MIYFQCSARISIRIRYATDGSPDVCGTPGPGLHHNPTQNIRPEERRTLAAHNSGAGVVIARRTALALQVRNSAKSSTVHSDYRVRYLIPALHCYR